MSVPSGERIRRNDVHFEHPFSVEGVEAEQPAGTYTIETVEELIEGLSFLAYRRISTSVVLPLPGRGVGSYQLVPIDPKAVQAAGGEHGPAI